MKAKQTVLLASMFIFFAPTHFVVAQAEIRVGVAEADITPPLGFRVAGYYSERLATGVRDPLKAKAIVFSEGDEQVALVACDLTGIAIDLTNEVRREVAKKTGLPETNIIITATHSHTAPDYTKDLYDYLAKRQKNKDESGAYSSKLIAGIVDAVVRAHAASQPVEIETGSATQQVPVSFNRRFVMKDGSVRTWMSLDNPDVVRPAGPIDPEIGIVSVRAANDKQPIAVLTNFALHLDTVGGTLWSGDYPYYIEQSIRSLLGSNVISIFGTGCCGDINHVDPSRKERNATDVIGNALGETIAASLPKLKRVEKPALSFQRTIVPLPLQVVSRADVDRAQQLLTADKSGTKVDFYDLVIAHKTIMLDQLLHATPFSTPSAHISWGLSHTWAGVGENLPVEVDVIGLGDDLAIVCLPGEIFVDLGLAIKQASPFRTTLVVELSNCVETIYVPTRAAYAGGSYEVTNAALQPGSGEMLVEAAIRLLREAATNQSQ